MKTISIQYSGNAAPKLVGAVGKMGMARPNVAPLHYDILSQDCMVGGFNGVARHAKAGDVLLWDGHLGLDFMTREQFDASYTAVDVEDADIIAEEEQLPSQQKPV